MNDVLFFLLMVSWPFFVAFGFGVGMLLSCFLQGLWRATPMKPAKTKRSSLANVMDWLNSCLMQAEADGYQQNEDMGCEWFGDPPEWFDVGKSSMKIRHGGYVFTLKITAKPDR
jgi:hypothetical protein